MTEGLAEYRKKRDFQITPEPQGGDPAEFPRFCVQRHEARRLHYDFRLESEGVLLSWAVPQGPSLDPSVKRLAVQTEDHPLDYLTFEGMIPKGEYGGGTVIVWDLGVYENITTKGNRVFSAHEAVEHGHIKFVLLGEKLRGTFALTRMGQKGTSDWLLVKVHDEFDDPSYDPVATRPESVLTSRINADVIDA